MDNLITFAGTVGMITFDFDNKIVKFRRNDHSKKMMGLKDLDIPFNDITEIEYKPKKLLTYPSLALIINGKRIISQTAIDLTEFFVSSKKDQEPFFEAVQHLAKLCNITELKDFNRGTIKQEHYVPGMYEPRSNEYRKKCNICGAILCYTVSDIERNSKLLSDAKTNNLMSVANAIGGSAYHMYEQNKQAERALDKIIDYTKCQKCGSSDLKDISEEEMKAEQSKLSNKVDSVSSADELRKYKQLLDDGIITQEEFDAKKKQLLGL